MFIRRRPRKCAAGTLGHGTLAGLVYLEFEAGAEAGVPLLDDSAAAFCESVAVSLANFRLREAQRLPSIRDPLTGPRKPAATAWSRRFRRPGPAAAEYLQNSALQSAVAERS